MPRASKIKPATDAQTITVTVPATAAANGQAPAAEPEKKDFWEQVADVPELGWGKDYMIYVYREEPAIRGLQGYLAKITEPIDREQFAEKFGGYVYRLMLNKNGKMICATKHSVATPPKAIGSMDPAMLASTMPGLASAGGADQTALIQFADIIRQQVEKQNPADKNTVELLMTASRSAMEIMRAQTPNPFDMFKTMMELQKQTAAPENGMMTALVGMMTAMMSKLMERSLAPDGGFASQLKSLLEIQQMMGAGGGEGGGRQRGPDFGTLLVSKLPELFQYGSVLMGKYVEATANNRRAAEMRAHTITVPPAAPGAAPQPPPTPAAAPAGGPVLVPQPAAAPAQPHHFAPIEREPLDTAAQILASDASPENLQRLKMKVVQSIMMGLSAESVVDYISIENPMLMGVLRQATVDTLRDFFAGDPTLAQAANYPGFENFLKEAVEYIRENAGDAVPEPAFKN